MFAAFADRDRAALKRAGKYLLLIACFLAGVVGGYFLTAWAMHYAILFVSALLFRPGGVGLLARRAARKNKRDTEEKEVP